MIKEIKKIKVISIWIILSTILISLAIIIYFFVISIKNEEYTQYKFFLNENKEDLTVTTDWGNKKNNSFIYTFEFFEKKVISNNFKYIKFYSKNDSVVDKSNYSWGNTNYQSKSINDAIKNIDLSNYLKNAKVTENGSNNPLNSCNIIICDYTQWYLGASLKITIKLGFTYYEENGKWYFQIIIRHYGETWVSASGGKINTPLGNSFIISKYSFNQ